MQDKKEYWTRLCEQAAVEPDPAKLMELVEETNRLLLEKEQRLEKLQRENAAEGANADD